MAKVDKEDREPLTPEIVQDVVVANTPEAPSPSPAPQTQLLKLGIVNKTTAKNHRAGIQEDIGDLGYSIAQGDIESSPTTTIAKSRDSVLANAK